MKKLFIIPAIALCIACNSPKHAINHHSSTAFMQFHGNSKNIHCNHLGPNTPQP